MADNRYTYKKNGEWKILVGNTEMCGPWVDRLAEFEELGLNPNEVQSAYDICIQNQVIFEQYKADSLALARINKRIAPKKPLRDSLADRSCPHCDAYIGWDALNEAVKDAPKFCKNCGQEFDWSDENGYNPNAEYV